MLVPLFVQMAYPLLYEIDVDGTTRTNGLHWEGFARILWDTLRDVGYTTPPTYEVLDFWHQGVPYVRAIATVLPHPGHPEWPDLSMVFFGHRGVEALESAALHVLHAFCEQHPDEVMLTPLGLFPARDPQDPAWLERVSLTEVLLTADPPEVTVRKLLRLLEAVFNMQVYRLSTQGMLSFVLMESATMRSALSWDLQQERQTTAYLQQELVTLQDERIQWHVERGDYLQQLFHRQNGIDLLRTQLEQSEAQRLALVENVVDMQHQVVDLEVEVEVWQHMANHPPAPPQVGPGVPDELQGHSGLDESSQAGPPPPSPPVSPAASEASVGN